MKILEIWEDLGEDGWLRQGILAEINGETVQFVRYDEDNSSILVKIGDRMNEMSSDEIPNFVRHRLELL